MKTKTILLVIIAIIAYKKAYCDDYTWTGTDENQFWSNPENWISSNPGSIPGNNDNVVLDCGIIALGDCFIDVDTITINSLSLIEYPYQLTLPYTILINGNLIITGEPFIEWNNTGNIVFAGNNDQSISIDYYLEWSLYNLIINKTSGSILLKNNVYVNNVFSNEHETNIISDPLENDYSIIIENPLPIELLTFEVHNVSGKITIFWSTATETNNDYFLIEKSNDCLSWMDWVR